MLKIKWKSRPAAIACVAVLLFAIATAALAFFSAASGVEDVYIMRSMPYFSIDDLFTKSTHAVIGMYTGKHESKIITHADGQNWDIFTDYDFVVSGMVRGQKPSDGREIDKISVRVDGGCVGKENRIVSAAPTFVEGEEYLLFLVKPGKEDPFRTLGDYYTILGLNQGVFLGQGSGVFLSETGVALDRETVEERGNESQIIEDYWYQVMLENYETNLDSGYILQEEYDRFLALSEKSGTVTKVSR